MAQRKHRITRPPYQCVYWKEYLADTTHLSTLQHGAYLKLWATYWQQGGPLPDDDDALASIVGVSAGQWAEELRPHIQPFFRVIPVTTASRRGANLPARFFGEDAGRVFGKDTNCWWHPRINADLNDAILKAQHLSKINSENARKRNR